ncbi:hypothetical protein JOC34_000388 [Virgibacillus halotolerans]|uniref:hypothetical protein n=1 Tax=Virgibacillus halotolerans TaxID=1071053 RepID=UPI00195F9500|nr:hypothetical protein [Virgibacillus halotolerans]MBM7598031.1 hypothetical protein [Virgibacillus halotolerans]
MTKTYRHDGADIIHILVKYVEQSSSRLRDKPGVDSFKYAAKQVAKGAEKLRRLKLSPEDRRHISLLYAAFSALRQSMEAAARGDVAMYSEKMRQANSLMGDYNRRCSG